MRSELAGRIAARTKLTNLVEVLAKELSGSELNSVLLEVFHRRCRDTPAAELLRQYQQNKFVLPAETDYIRLLEKSVATLKIFRKNGFNPIQVSPLSALGTCSILAPVAQDKVITSLRNTEVLSDASNAIALHIASLKKNKKLGKETARFGCVQRHVRAQPTHMKGFSPHFTIGCLVSAGPDNGNYSFERRSIVEHFKTWEEVLGAVYGIDKISFKFYKRAGYAFPGHLIAAVLSELEKEGRAHSVSIADEAVQNNYYLGIQFKVIVTIKENTIEIADGGFVDWTQRLLTNKKERMCISGFGLELLNKFEEGLIP